MQLHRQSRAVKLLLAHLRARAVMRPPGYYDFVVSHGRIEDDELVLADSTYQDLVKLYQSPAGEMVYARRQNACAACVDEVCRRCPNTELQRRMAGGGCPLGLWPC